MSELHTRVIRTLGSNRIHVAEVPAGQFTEGWFVQSYLGVETPVVARCGALLRDADRPVVCMNPATKVTCARCRRITGIVVAADDNRVAPAEVAP